MFILETVLQFSGPESETGSRNRRIPPLSGGDDTSAAFARWGKEEEEGIHGRKWAPNEAVWAAGCSLGRGGEANPPMARAL